MGASRIHESARAQVAGTATYIDDLPEARGTLHAAPILSPVAHGRLRGVNTQAAQALPGVRGVVLAADIPGDPLLATFVHDEPIFAIDTVQHVGQVIGVVVADSGNTTYTGAIGATVAPAVDPPSSSSAARHSLCCRRTVGLRVKLQPLPT
jgi:xanthine dehydrogenase large subunit